MHNIYYSNLEELTENRNSFSYFLTESEEKLKIQEVKC